MSKSCCDNVTEKVALVVNQRLGRRDLTPDDEDAEMQAAENALRARGQVRDPSAVPAWLSRIRHNAQVDALRQRTRGPETVGIDALSAPRMSRRALSMSRSLTRSRPKASP